MNYGRADLTELSLTARAIRNRWPISKDTRDRLPAEMAYILEHGDTKAKIAAARVLIEADKVNLADEQSDMLRQLQAMAAAQRELLDGLTGEPVADTERIGLASGTDKTPANGEKADPWAG